MPEDANAAEFQNAGPRDFRTTHWSMVLRAGDRESPDAASALERLCRMYWYPLYAFVRRKGYPHEEAQDLTQGFFENLLAKGYLAAADGRRGKFRTFLLTSFTNFLANERDRKLRLKRGGHLTFLSLDAEAEAEERYKLEPVSHETADRLFEQRWAQTIMESVLGHLADEMEPGRFEVLKGFLLGEEDVSYAAVAAHLGLSVPAVTSAIYRMRARFGVLLREEIAHTVTSEDEVEEEIRQLIKVLTD